MQIFAVFSRPLSPPPRSDSDTVVGAGDRLLTALTPGRLEPWIPAGKKPKPSTKPRVGPR